MAPAGPACGWVLAYLDGLLSSYAHLTLASAFRLSLSAGLALLEARSCRLYPGQTLSHIDRAIIAARNRTRRHLLATHRLITAEDAPLKPET